MIQVVEQWSKAMAGMNGSSPVAQVVLQQADAAWQSQNEVIGQIKLVADRWCERRQDSIQDTHDLSLAVRQAGSPASALDAWNKWCSGTMARAVQDVGDQFDLITCLARCYGSVVVMPAIAARGSDETVGDAKKALAKSLAKSS